METEIEKKNKNEIALEITEINLFRAVKSTILKVGKQVAKYIVCTGKKSGIRCQKTSFKFDI